MSEPQQPAPSTYERALELLDARARTVDELRRLLVRNGEPPTEVDEAIGRLRHAGLLDDANFARQLTRSKAIGSGHSRRRIQQELSRRGVAREISARAIEDVFAEEHIDEAASIERVARKKVRTLGRLDPAAQRRRLYAFLARRGYDADDIQRVLRVVLGDDADQ